MPLQVLRLLLGGYTLKARLIACGALLVAALAGLGWFIHQQREIGENRLQNRIDKADKATLENMVKDNAEIRNLDTDGLVDELVDGVR